MVKPLASALLLLLLSLPPRASCGHRGERQVMKSDANTHFNVRSVPFSLSFYGGNDTIPLDDCPRDEVKLANGRCYQLLTQGPCRSTDYVLLDPTTEKAYCGPRLCSPDRIFVFSNQLCYDPTDPEICPNGLQLFQTSYGTPVCQCPDGSYENDDDDDQDEATCESLLTSSASCPPGQVLWFRNFSSPRECIVDPCGGENLRRPPGKHILVPSAIDGRCYPLGQGAGACPEGSFFTLDFNTLKGICSKLEDAGYLVLNDALLSELEDFYGAPIQKNRGNRTIPQQMMDLPSKQLPVNKFMRITTNTRQPSNAYGIPITENPNFQRIVTRGRGRDRYIGKQSRTRIELFQGDLVTETRVRGSYPGVFSRETSLDIGLPIARRFGSSDIHFVDAITHLLINMPHPRWKRDLPASKKPLHRDHRRTRRRTVLPHFAPGNIFDTRLVSCRPGAQRDINAKCRDTILPSRSPSRMSSGLNDLNKPLPAATPAMPKPACSPGEMYNLQRLCVNASVAINSINASELG